MKCTHINSLMRGILCSCGRTIWGKFLVKDHFGMTLDEAEKEVDECPTPITPITSRTRD